MDALCELWTAIPRAPAYEVSTLGQVRRAGVLVAQWSNAKGYRLVNLEVPDLTFPRAVYVHELVLEAFVGRRPLGHQADHSNGDRGDNSLVNLSWVTPAENVRRARARQHATLERVFGQLRLFDRAS